MKTARSAKVLPRDQYNDILVAHVAPPDWENPQPAQRYNLVVIGAGTAGLVTAAGAAGLGAKVALVEKHLLGGDCLNVGCVPSKALIRCARAAADVRRVHHYGIVVPSGMEIEFATVMERMRRLRSDIAVHDSAQRFRALGVDVFLGEAFFSGRETVEVEGSTLRFEKAVIATGARAMALPIEGLAAAGYLTNETVFSLTERPPRLAVVGGGPLGCELAQAFRRLGSEVILFQSSDHLLDREDRDAAEILQRTFLREGIQLLVRSQLQQVTRTEQGKIIHYEQDGRPEQVVVDEILLGAGRAPNVDGLRLEVAGVGYDRKSGVAVNDYLQTSNPRIYAAGDICMRHKFTHMADAAARIVIQNALFMGRAKLSALTVPWCTYTDPEIAHVGVYERDARAKGIRLDTFVQPLSAVDRAILDGEAEGFVKVHVKQGTDQILGATIVARHAGNMISELSLAMVAGVGLKTIAQVIHPYPTQAEAIKKVADAYNRTRLSPFLRRLMGRWFAWRRSRPARHHPLAE
ncbi:MAG TPA: FAD-containing oxidoreductase [Syntrophobacteraceae bacterium]|nr:FAD-containing oxidoreductase [Syntrophobacteraceae bacterium]